MHLIVNDSVSSAALALAGVHVNQNPFIEPLRKNRAKVRKLIDRIENAVREPGSKVRPWTSCADAQRAALKEQVPSYTNYANAEASAGSWDEIVADINAMIAWRDELWSSLPLCADTLELALTFSLLAGNRRALVAYRQARVADEKNPYWEAIELGEHIIDGYGGWLVGGSAVRQSAQRLRSCTDTELQSLSITVAQYYMLREAMTNIENMRDFVNTRRCRTGLARLASWHLAKLLRVIRGWRANEPNRG